MKCNLRVEKCIHNWKKSENAPQVETMLFKHFGQDTTKPHSFYCHFMNQSLCINQTRENNFPSHDMRRVIKCHSTFQLILSCDFEHHHQNLADNES